MTVMETKDSRYILAKGFGDRLDIWKKESRMVFSFLTWVLCGQWWYLQSWRRLRKEEISVGGGGINSSMLNILSVSCCVGQGPGRKRELSPDNFNRGNIIYRTSYRGIGRAKTGDGETTQRLLMAGLCPNLGGRYKGKR